MSPSPGKPSTTSNSGLATLIVMIVVLTIIILFCCFSAPGIRDLCKKYVFRTCVMDDPEQDNASTTGNSTTPTIILLPYGRMLVVDRAVFAQLQADHTGIDFMELSANLIRAQRYQTGSTPSILDSETTSKGLSPTSLGLSPPAYEDIFGEKKSDLPPSYSEVSLIFGTYHHDRRMFTDSANIETLNMDERNAGGNRSDIDVNNENNLNRVLFEQNPCDDNNSVHITIADSNPSTSQENQLDYITRNFPSTNDCSVRESSI